MSKKKKNPQAPQDVKSDEKRSRHRIPSKKAKRQLDRGQKILLLVIVSAILVYAVCFFFIFKPLYDERDKLAVQENELREQLEDTPKKVDLSEDLQRIHEFVPLEVSADDLLENIQNVVSEHDVIVTSIQAEDLPLEAFNDRILSSKYTITLEASDYFETNDLIEALEKAERLITVDEITMTHSASDEALEVILVLSAYHQTS